MSNTNTQAITNALAALYGSVRSNRTAPDTTGNDGNMPSSSRDALIAQQLQMLEAQQSAAEKAAQQQAKTERQAVLAAVPSEVLRAYLASSAGLGNHDPTTSNIVAPSPPPKKRNRTGRSTAVNGGMVGAEKKLKLECSKGRDAQQGTRNPDNEVVDLPPNTIATSPTTVMNIRRNSVRFKYMSRLAFIEPESRAESNIKWYKREDKKRFMLVLKADAQRMREKLVATPPHTLDQDEMYECVGMESLLSRNVFMHVRQHKLNHVRAILAAQARQKRSDVHDEEELSRLSERSSAGARGRAASVAVGYWELSPK